MRVTLNLSVAPSVRERYALAWAVPATLVGLAGLVFLAASIVREYRIYRDVHRSLANHQETENRSRDREMALRKDLEQPQFREVLREAQFVNGLIGKKQVSLTELAAKVAKLLPGQVRLNGLALTPQGSDLVVRFIITGKNEETLETFLSNLEDSPDFIDVAIINQGFEQEGTAGGPVSIACTARYLVGSH
jgi:hypothetical protein